MGIILQQIMTVIIYQLDKVKNCHLPSASLFISLLSVYYSGLKLFNKLKLELKHIPEHPNKLKGTVKNYLLTHRFYSLDELFSNE
jgi:hypothetical protein